MNERIKQLAEQAGFKILTDGRIIPTLDHNGECGRDLKKFAELIVKECAQVCVEVGDANSDIYPEFGNGAYFSANRVKQYFGVEE